MKEPLRRKNLHSIISKISGNVEASQQSEEELTVSCEEQTTGDEKTDSNLKIADEQPTSLNMFPKEADVMITTKANEVIHQADPKLVDHHAGPYSCQLCHIGFLTRHELQLHVMCHGIYISDDTSNPGGRNIKSTTQVTVSRGELDKNVGPEAGEMPCRKSPVIQNPNDIAPRAESIGSSKKDQSVPHSYDIAASPTSNATSLEEQEKLAANKTQNGLHPPLSDSGSSEASYGRIVDVLSLATATTGFKQPGSIWCSLCKCTVERGHICKVHQTSYHADKTEEGFTCELCGRYYNQKRKLRTHLRNRHKGFRLQEDEGYMCWQCWQAFPEIKILEEHIVTVHGHESRRQNSTWRPFTMTPSTLPSSGDTCEEPTPLPTGIGPPIPSALSPTDQQTTNLKRPGDTIPDHCPIKKTPREGVPVQEVLNVGEVNGKVVVNDIFTVSPEVPLCPQTTGASGASHSSITATTQPTAEVFERGALQSQPASVPVVTPSENSWNKQSYTSHGGNVRGDAKDDVSVSNLRIIPGATASNVQSSNMNSPSSKKKNPSQCPHCPKKFAKKHMLHLHIQQNHGENMHCFFCSTSCGTREALASHIRSTHQGEVMNGKCPICQCKCLGELAQHIVQYHYKDLLTRKDKDRVLSTCPICNQTTTDTYHLRWHILKEHRGLQVSVDYLEGSTGETSSEGGSPVTSEGRMGYEGPDRIMGVPRGSSSLAEGNSAEDNPAEESENVRVKKEPDVDEVEIVFVSDKNIDSDWSKPRQEKTHRSESGSTAGCMATVETPTVSVDSVKKPADSSVSSNSSSKLGQTRVAADQVHSTTGLEETKAIDTSPTDPQYPISTSKSNYVRVSEEACIFCFNSFPDKETLVSHLRSAHGWVDTFNCPICSYRGGTYLNVVEHFCVSHFYPIEETETQSEVKCLKCDILFPDIAHLKKHVSALHSFQIPAEPKYDTFKCRHCNIIFEKQFDAQKHFDVYHLFRIRYKCESCRMGFTAKHDFQEHVTCNHPELVKSFCPVCGLGFEVNADLEEHVFEMHRRKAQFYCAQCGNEFADRFHVHMHIRSNCCVKWADSNFECLDCLTAFSSISELRIHCNQRSCKLNSKN